jgi:uncharacterized membrane protein
VAVLRVHDVGLVGRVVVEDLAGEEGVHAGGVGDVLGGLGGLEALVREALHEGHRVVVGHLLDVRLVLGMCLRRPIQLTTQE